MVNKKMTEPTKIFLDTEFTGLHSDAQLISIALTTIDGKKIYAIRNDLNEDEFDPWIKENIIKNLYPDFASCEGKKQWVKFILSDWLSQFDSIEIWADVLAWDWVLFCDLFGGAFKLPKNIHYIPRDISTALLLAGVAPDIDRVEYAKEELENIFDGKPYYKILPKHNALRDALVTAAVYRKLMK